MKWIAVVASVATFALGNGAFAADLASRAPAPMAPLFTWTGFYFGANVGYGWGKTTGSAYVTTTGVFASTIDRSADGAVGGGQIGFNYQFQNNVVLGVEVDASASGIKGSQTFLAPSATPEIAAVSTGKTTAFGTVRGRLGYAFGNILPYVTGGWAWRDTSSTRTQYATALTAAAAPAYSTIPVISEQNSGTNYGWALGAGAEWAFAQNWTAKIEYLYMDFGNETTFNPLALSSVFSYVAPGVSNGRTSYTSSHAQIVRLGLNYKFN